MWRCTLETLLGVSFETSSRRCGDVPTAWCYYVFFRRCHDVPSWRRGDVLLRQTDWRHYNVVTTSICRVWIRLICAIRTIKVLAIFLNTVVFHKFISFDSQDIYIIQDEDKKWSQLNLCRKASIPLNAISCFTQFMTR